MVEKLCEKYGTCLIEYDEVSHYNFPTIEVLAESKVESSLRTLGFGYRAKFIQQSAQKILENGGRDWLLNLRNVPYQEAKKTLMTLPGIGAKVIHIFISLSFSVKANFEMFYYTLKVADCICLMSLNHSCAIPVDTHVFQIAKKTYLPHLGGTKTVTDRVYNEISTYFQTLFGSHSGWAHSVFNCH